jgi:hypothetical protein
MLGMNESKMFSSKSHKYYVIFWIAYHCSWVLQRPSDSDFSQKLQEYMAASKKVVPATAWPHGFATRLHEVKLCL